MKIPIQSLVRAFAVAAVALFLSVQAAEPTPTPPQEFEYLKALPGRWHLEGEISESPFGSAGRDSFETEMRFRHNGFALEEAGVANGDDGGKFSYSITTYYDSKTKTVSGIFLDSVGGVMRSRVKVTKGMVLYQWDEEAKGKTYKCKDTMRLAPDGASWTYEWMYSEDGVNWKLRFRGTAKRVGKA